RISAGKGLGIGIQGGSRVLLEERLQRFVTHVEPSLQVSGGHLSHRHPESTRHPVYPPQPPRPGPFPVLARFLSDLAHSSPDRFQPTSIMPDATGHTMTLRSCSTALPRSGSPEQR